MTTLTLASMWLLLRAARQIRRFTKVREEPAVALTAMNEDLERRVREQTAEALRASAHFQAAFSSSPIGSAMTTTGGTIELANDELLALLGRGQEELRGSPVQDLFEEEHAATDRGCARRWSAALGRGTRRSASCAAATVRSPGCWSTSPP